MGTTMIGGHVVCQKVTVTLAAADIVADAVLASIDVPGDAIMLDVILETEDLDTGAAGLLDVGDSAGPTVPDDDRFVAAFSCQAAGSIRASDSAGLLEGTYQYSTTGEQTIEVTVNTAPATAAAGDVSLTVIYTRQ